VEEPPEGVWHYLSTIIVILISRWDFCGYSCADFEGIHYVISNVFVITILP